MEATISSPGFVFAAIGLLGGIMIGWQFGYIAGKAAVVAKNRSVAQLEAELAGMKLMEAEAERFAEDIVAENERLLKIEIAAKAIDAEWFIDYKDCPEEVRALHEVLGGKP